MNQFRNLFQTSLALAIMYLASYPFQSARATTATFTNIPASVSNTYTGTITLYINGLNAGDTVVVQKFLDLNSNGVIDSGDLLVQQFQLTDGQGPPVIATITNINIPGDLNPASGAVTAQLNPVGEGFEQLAVGQYLFKLSSPSNSFTPVTNLLAVTNFPFAQSFTGTVVSNGTSTIVPYAMVVLSAPGNNFNPQAAAVANSSGNYTIKAPPGTYRLNAIKTNGFVTDIGSAPILTLSNNASINTNLSLLPATQTISGQLVDATNAGLALPAMLMVAVSSNGGVWGFGSANSNGNYSLPVNSAGQWSINQESQGFDFHGYVKLHDGTNANAGATGVTIAFPKATALIYGSVKDGSNNPLAGLRMAGDNGNNGSGIYEGDATTFQNGFYVVGVLASNWSVSVDQSSSGTQYANYIFSQGPAWAYNNGGSGSNITAGTAVQVNFTGLVATNTISGYVKDTNGNPIVGVGVNANATISNVNYSVGNADTDSNGFYSLPVANSTNWNVSLNCCPCCGSNNGSGDSLSSNYQCPGPLNESVFNNNVVADFTVMATLTDVTGYNFSKQESFVQTGPGAVSPSTNNPFQMKFTINQAYQGAVLSATVTPPGGTPQSFPSGSSAISLKIRANYANQGSLDAAYPSGSYALNLDTQDNCAKSLMLNLPATAFPTTPQTTVFTAAQAINASDDFTIQWNTFVGGTTSDIINFDVNDTNGNTIVSSPSYLEPGWLNGTATGFTIPGGTLQPGLNYQVQLSFVKVQNLDTNSYPGSYGLDGFQSQTTFNIATLSGTTTNSGFLIMSPALRSGGGFEFTLETAPGVNYTILVSTDLKTWSPTSILNSAAGGPFSFVDLTAGTTGQRFYRIQIGP